MGAVREQVSEASTAFANVFRNRELRRINLALAGSVVGDWAYGMAVSIWAYQQGGATAVGVFGVARYLSIAVLAPVMATFADRLPKKRVMIAADLSRVVLVVAGAAFIAADGPAIFVYALALVTSVIGSGFRPAQAALIPRLANDPRELTGANVVASTIESVGFFIGPAIGALLLAFSDIPEVYLFNAATFAASAAILTRLHVPAPVVEIEVEAKAEVEVKVGVGGSGGAGAGADAASDAGEAATTPGFLREMLAGFGAIWRDRNLRLISSLYLSQTVIAGASLVFEVAVVFELLDRGESTLGLLGAVMGVGGLVGGVVAMVMARRERLAADFGIGVVLWAAPLLVIVAWPTLAAAAGAMLLIGLGNSIVDINAYTIIQRVTPDAVMGRVFGALESITIGGMAIGALLMPLMIGTIGLRSGLAVLGIAVTAVVLVSGRALDRIDRSVLAPPGLKLLRQVPMLSVLPAAVLELLARSLVTLTVPAGTDVIREGDRGDRYWVIERGHARVTVAGEEIRTLGPGDGFGEIALLRDVPRTATVTALDELTVKGLDRDVFIPAVTGHSDANEQAEVVMTRWLGLA